MLLWQVTITQRTLAMSHSKSDINARNVHVLSQVSRLNRMEMQINPTTATGLIEQAGLDEVSTPSPDLSMGWCPAVGCQHHQLAAR